MKKLLLVYFAFFTVVWPVLLKAQDKINRKALVQRHNVINNDTDTLSSLSVGNGRFAFTVDATGLQTFPEHYDKGIPLGTQSEWGWHSFKDTAGYKFDETLKNYALNGRNVSYSVQWNQAGRNRNAANWFRENVHRLQLGNLGFLLLHKDGSEAQITDIQNIRQELDLWTGAISSSFTFDGELVTVQTYAHQGQDLIAVKVQSPLLAQGRLKVRLRFPFPTNQFADYGDNWKNPQKHYSAIVSSGGRQSMIIHRLDTNQYFVRLAWDGVASVNNTTAHQFVLSPQGKTGELTFTCSFNPQKSTAVLPGFAQTQANSIQQWKAFWQSGGAVDFSGSTDPRAKELERRVVLSQYLTKIQCSGHQPPQETGLTYNSWYGKPHLEMHWWHGIHFALWGREQLLENSLGWYHHVKANARAIAKRQGYDGIRWQKMTDPDGNESPSSVGAFLIWQQPHFIYFAELDYRAHSNKETLNKYKDLVLADADFMASFPTYDKEHDRYNLGKGIILAQERYKPEETYNPTYELQYWRWALNTAQLWRKRLGMPPDRRYAQILDKLALLPQKDGVYLAAESSPDAYTNPKLKTDHPAVLAAYGMLPYNDKLDTTVMKKTFNLVWDVWDWKDTWGWDFPMTAMTAARLNMPEKAIDALFMPIKTNTYLTNGHNYQDGRLRMYLPGNGGLLAAVAMMCAGWDGSTTVNPGFPKDGKWKVKWEGLKKMP
ncbi:hypothetical protein J3L18_03675 [Mucilaginibacter gossypii]|uniref:hypothetical protein n=1 Tax=Mucilaginibacter gossypii TaxID=551996 RepID=UPI000DCDE6CE|nr:MULTISPECIES: hypothetical protein [Mucilaginibacter]QTE38183.1 hypothetical protein J3L18_03675 [Mucilaginibacter gossypii]RAV60342.1 hypothetical protein DIU36_01635 [Mucilaginibacter rubeus]